MTEPSNASAASVVQTFRGSVALLGTRRFGTFWFANLLSNIGTWAQQVAEPWLLLTLGAPAFLIGLDSFMLNAPVWLLTMLGGALADRADRRRVITVFQSLQMLCPLAIVALLVTHKIHPWIIVALSAIVGVTDALSMPSFQSIVPSIVDREQIGSGLALNATQFNLSRVLGPSVAGLLISSVGVTACFVVNAVSYVPFIGVALWILPRRIRDAANAAGSPRPDLRDGVVEILRQPQLRCALLTVLTTSLFCAPFVTFVSVLVKDVFRGGAGHFSSSVAAFGVGGLLGALILLGVGPRVDRRRLSSGFALVYAAVVAVSAVSPWFWVIPPLLVVGGASMTISNTVANSVLQGTADPKRLGQTVSLYMLAMRGGLSLGAVLTGAAASLLGVQRALVIDGLIAVAAQLLLARAWAQAAPSISI